MIDDDESKQAFEQKTRYVPIGKYNELLSKNRELEEKVATLEMKNAESNKSNLVAEMVQDKKEVSEVVDLGEVLPKKEEPIKVKNLDDEIALYQKAAILKDNNKIEEAVKIFNTLQSSNQPQIVARAKHALGAIYDSQGQYDLAVQMYKEVIEKYASSGVVLKALKSIVHCFEKLGLKEEKLKYEALNELLNS